jgi:Cdc6-like AAA superfamily ATPase
MGIIGEDLLSRIASAESHGDWEAVLDLLRQAKDVAEMNYTKLMADMTGDSDD